VGQDGLHFIAEALELPLYRRVIHGTAVDQESDYASTSAARLQGRVEGDETEDLYDLLTEVLVRFLSGPSCL
jgi:diphthine-ammonia ligase